MDIRTILLDVLGSLEIDPEMVTNGTRLRDELDIDSTELVELAVAIERQLPVTLDIEAFLKLGTFGDLVAFVQSAPRSERV